MKEGKRYYQALINKMMKKKENKRQPEIQKHIQYKYKTFVIRDPCHFVIYRTHAIYFIFS